MTATATEFPARSATATESIWRAASVLDNDPDFVIQAVVVIRTARTGYLCSGEFGSVKGARRGWKRHAAKSYADATYIVTRGRGEGFNVEQVA